MTIFRVVRIELLRIKPKYFGEYDDDSGHHSPRSKMMSSVENIDDIINTAQSKKLVISHQPDEDTYEFNKDCKENYRTDALCSFNK